MLSKPGLHYSAPLVTKSWHWSDDLSRLEQPPGATDQNTALGTTKPPWEFGVCPWPCWPNMIENLGYLTGQLSREGPEVTVLGVVWRGDALAEEPTLSLGSP